MTNEETKSDKLKSIRKRIELLRNALEDPTLLTEIEIGTDAIKERFNRKEACEELRKLEAEEDLLTGRRSRVYGISLR